MNLFFIIKLKINSIFIQYHRYPLNKLIYILTNIFVYTVRIIYIKLFRKYKVTPVTGNRPTTTPRLINV